MIDYDVWTEITLVIRKNKLRSLLTALGIFWGIFMLIMMIGFGNGLSDGARESMSGMGNNTVYLWSQRTSEPYGGHNPGREIRFDTKDYEAIVNTIDGIDVIAPRTQLAGYRGTTTITAAERSANFQVIADYPDLAKVRSFVFTAGRFFNPNDMAEHRKVAVIGKRVWQELFPEAGSNSNTNTALGKYINVQGVPFQVVGVFRSKRRGDMGEGDESTVHIPFATYLQAFGGTGEIGWFAIRAKDGVAASEMENQVRTLLKTRHKIAPTDAQALGSFNAQKEFSKISRLFRLIDGLIWIVGLMTLLAGVVGVSNIMLIAIRERTQEIGLRKALGATPFSIVGLIVREALLLTVTAGVAGIVVGVACLRMLGKLLSDADMLAAPTVSLGVVVFAFFILLVCGVVAGIIPAGSAARIQPIAALRQSDSVTRGFVMAKRNIIPIVFLLVLVVAFLGTLRFLYKSSQKPEVGAKTTKPSVRDIVKKSVASGSLVPRHRVELKPNVSGIVAKLFVEPGALVKKGDRIATIDIVANVVSVNQAQARLANAKLRAGNAKREFARHSKLFKESVISDRELGTHELEYKLARQEVVSAQRNLRLIKSGNAGKTQKAANEVRATVEGMVLDIPVKEGQSVTESNNFNPGTTIAAVADMNDIIFEGLVDEAEVGRLQPGLELTIRVGALPKQKFAGVLEYVAPQGTDNSGTIQFLIRAKVSSKQDVFLRSGYSANADLILNKANQVLSIEESCLVFQGDKTFVEIEQVKPNTFKKQQVTLGLSDGIHVEIQSGITKDDTVKIQQGEAGK